jgi:lipoprotein-releasing system permease protein
MKLPLNSIKSNNLKACIRIIGGYLSSRKFRFLPNITVSISIFAIAVSVATLIITKSVMNGFRRELISAIISINSHINLYNNNYKDEYIKIDEGYKNFTKKHQDKIIYTGGIITKTGMIMHRDSSSGVIIKALEAKDFKNRPKMNLIYKGENFLKNQNCILIGKDLARKNRIFVGSKVKIIIPKMIKTMFGAFPVTKEYEVCDIIKTDAAEYDAIIVMMHAPEMRKLYEIKKNEFSNIEIFIKNHEKTEEILYSVKEDFGRKYILADWKSENRNLISALKTEAAVMFLILSLFVLISILSVFLSIRNLIKEKIREIAILSTMGFTKSEISFIFFNISFLISCIGTAIGCATGIFLALNLQEIKSWIEKIFHINLFESSVYLLSHLPTELQTGDIYNTIIFVLFFSIFFSFMLAKMSLKNKAFDVLKHY